MSRLSLSKGCLMEAFESDMLIFILSEIPDVKCRKWATILMNSMIHPANGSFLYPGDIRKIRQIDE
jgi:hypothetical protein